MFGFLVYVPVPVAIYPIPRNRFGQPCRIIDRGAFIPADKIQAVPTMTCLVLRRVYFNGKASLTSLDAG